MSVVGLRLKGSSDEASGLSTGRTESERVRTFIIFFYGPFTEFTDVYCVCGRGNSPCTLPLYGYYSNFRVLLRQIRVCVSP